MEGLRFDRLVRSFARGGVSRRSFFALLAGVAGVQGARAQGDLACRPEGAWCGMWGRCCDGLVCEVPTVNPNLGTCKTGTDTTGTGIVLAGFDPTKATAQATDQANQKKSRRSSKRSKRKGRRSNRRSRHNSNNNRSTTTTTTSTPTPTPTPTTTTVGNLQATLDCGATPTSPELTTLRNTGNVQLQVRQIEPLIGMPGATPFDSTEGVVIARGKTLAFSSGAGDLGSQPTGIRFWINVPVYNETKPGEGALVTVQTVEGAPRTLYFKAFCDSSKPTQRFETDPRLLPTTGRSAPRKRTQRRRAP